MADIIFIESAFRDFLPSPEKKDALVTVQVDSGFIRRDSIIVKVADAPFNELRDVQVLIQTLNQLVTVYENLGVAPGKGKDLKKEGNVNRYVRSKTTEFQLNRLKTALAKAPVIEGPNNTSNAVNFVHHMRALSQTRPLSAALRDGGDESKTQDIPVSRHKQRTKEKQKQQEQNERQEARDPDFKINEVMKVAIEIKGILNDIEETLPEYGWNGDPSFLHALAKGFSAPFERVEQAVLTIRYNECRKVCDQVLATEEKCDAYYDQNSQLQNTLSQVRQENKEAQEELQQTVNKLQEQKSAQQATLEAQEARIKKLEEKNQAQAAQISQLSAVIEVDDSKAEIQRLRDENQAMRSYIKKLVQQIIYWAQGFLTVPQPKKKQSAYEQQRNRELRQGIAREIQGQGADINEEKRQYVSSTEQETMRGEAREEWIKKLAPAPQPVASPAASSSSVSLRHSTLHNSAAEGSVRNGWVDMGTSLLNRFGLGSSS